MAGLSPDNCDLVFYYGDIRFFPHLLRLFLVKRIEVSVTWLDQAKQTRRPVKTLWIISQINFFGLCLQLTFVTFISVSVINLRYIIK